jgi:4a-hydroxytetrahydrobiopterin dehydratase
MELLSQEKAMSLLSENNLNEWSLKGKELERVYLFNDFLEAMVFVNKLADIAEELQHHPDIRIVWNKVTLNISTHDAGGLTEKDIELAKKIQAI